MKIHFTTTLIIIVIFFLPYNSISQDFIKVGGTKDFADMALIYTMTQGLPLFFQDFDTRNECIAALKSGEIDSCIIPLDAALTLYSKSKKKIAFLCVTQSVDYYCVSKNASTLANMVGKVVTIQNDTFAKGYLSWILSKSDIPVGPNLNEVHLNITNIPQSKLLNRITSMPDILLLSEPAKTALQKTADTPLYYIDLQDHYLNITGYNFMLPKNVLIARRDFLKNEDALKILTDSVRSSITTLNSNLSLSLNTAKSLGIEIQESVATYSIARANFVYTTAKESKDSVYHYIEIYNKATQTASQKLHSPDNEFFGY